MAKKWTFVVFPKAKPCGRCTYPHTGMWQSLPVTAPQATALCPPCFEKE